MVTAIYTPATAKPAPFSVNAASVLKSIQKSLQSRLHNKLDAIIELAQTLRPFSGNMLELHFDRNEAPFDFACRISRDYDAPLLNRALLSETILPFLPDESGELFKKSRPCFRYGIENVCMEYDFPFHAPPALFFDLHRDTEFIPSKIFEDLKELASAFQQPVHEELPDFFAKIKAAGLYVVYAGFMLSRKSKSVRFTIEGVKPDALTKALTALGWKGDYDILNKLRKTYLQADQRLVLCVDFDRQLGHKLGIEVHTPHWELLLEKLFTNRICNNQQYNLLKNWYGKTALSHHLSKELTSLHQRAITCVFRRINHLKFTLESGTITTKAYLYYCF